MAQVLLDSDGLPCVAAASLSSSSSAAGAAGGPCAAAVAGGAAGDSNEVQTGTTIVACCYAGGVVLGADSRTSAGSYVVNRAARKITRLSDRICVCRSGSAADTQALAQIARVQLQMYSQELPRQYEGAARVRVAAHLLQKLSYEYKDVLTAGLIVGGWDPVEGPQVFSIPIGGSCIPVKYTAGGSGSVFITAFLDEHFRPDLTKEEAMQLVSKAVAHAIHRDGSSGGLIRLVTIEEEAMEEVCITGDNLPVDP
ncbi:proteasome component PRE3 precursor, putative [Eimeria mitis]|uniref:proteasome endopeptidase complex n=1 Tax=Eimeria mitis TaxID=44415 RepID=U6KEK8_9EIME|nr:proteasome component PRE3 precursor, putative [Eimeria mitis]CDJ36455.1 proteasome component PRE3 precursor, putative [Eimeria mitis]